MSLTAYIRYDQTGRIVPGGPIVVKDKPAVGNWQPVVAGTNVTLVGQLRAFVKLDRYNKPLAGTLFLGKERPATGKWIEVNATYTGAATPTTSTTTTTFIPTTTSTTTQGVNLTYYYVTQNGSNVLTYRNYDLDPNTYYIYNNNGYPVYYLGSIGIGTQFFYDQALTQPVGSYISLFLPTNQSYTAPANSIFYQLDSTGTIVSEVGITSNLAWNQFGNNPSLKSRVQNDLVLCNEMYLSGFMLAPGVTTIGVGTTVYNGADQLFSYWNYLSYNEIIYTLNGGSTVLSQQSCSNITTTTTTTTIPEYTIGQQALGGVIAYINGGGSTGTSGLVATIEDISTSAEWGCRGTAITGADGAVIGTGNQNTIDIMAGCPTAGIAARLCGDLVQGGYSDWYLPSKDELNALYTNRVAIGGFANNWYWSSTEFNVDNAFFQHFQDGLQLTNDKSYPTYVRAVRSF